MLIKKRMRNSTLRSAAVLSVLFCLAAGNVRATPIDRLELYVNLPDGVDLVGGHNPVALRLAAGERRELELTLGATRWGAHMLGPHVTDLIAEAVLAIRNELTVEELVATIHAHPTLSEVTQEAGYDALGRAVHK